VRERNEIKKINERYILSEWKPFSDVTIQTYLIPYGEYHMRIHKIQSQRKLYAEEGGFAIKRWEEEKDKYVECDEQKALVQTPEDVSLVLNLSGYRKGITILSENTNLHVQRSVLPMLETAINEGETLLACAVLAGSRETYSNELTEGFYNECIQVFRKFRAEIGKD
jgi:hypothetical protein